MSLSELREDGLEEIKIYEFELVESMGIKHTGLAPVNTDE